MITSLATHSKATRSDFNAGKELQFDWNFFNQNLHLIAGLPVVCITQPAKSFSSQDTGTPTSWINSHTRVVLMCSSECTHSSFMFLQTQITMPAGNQSPLY